MTVNEGKPVVLVAVGSDDAGNFAPLDPNVALIWSDNPKGIVSLAPGVPGAANCTVTFVTPGSVEITCVGDADLTSGVDNVSGSIDLSAQPMATKIIVTALPQS